MSKTILSKDMAKLAESYGLDCKQINSVSFMTDLDVMFGGIDPKKFKNQMTVKNVWRRLSREDNLSIAFLEEFYPYIGYYCISRNFDLSEEYIRKNKDNLNWAMVTQHQTMSEEFLNEMKDYIDFSKLPMSPSKLSELFIMENIENFNIRNLLIFKSKELSFEFKETLKEIGYRYV